MSRCPFLIDGDLANQCARNAGHDGQHEPSHRRHTAEDEGRSQIHRTFAYHRPAGEAISKVTQLRECFSAIKERIETLCPQSRERAVALTELETSAMWAIKSVVLNDPNSIVDG